MELFVVLTVMLCVVFFTAAHLTRLSLPRNDPPQRRMDGSTPDTRRRRSNTRVNKYGELE